MPTGADPGLLVDTSVAVALLVTDHPHHRAVFSALRGRDLGLAGHAAFETFSVLTRLPPAARLPPADVTRMLARAFPHSRFLSARASAGLLATLASQGIAGGAIYDALVGAVAAEHDCTLATRDRRALDTYRALDVRVRVLD